jgi:hypothetical protein
VSPLDLGRLHRRRDREEDHARRDHGPRPHRDPISLNELPDRVADPRRVGVHRLVGQMPFELEREFVCGFVSLRPLLRHRATHDPIYVVV